MCGGDFSRDFSFYFLIFFFFFWFKFSLSCKMCIKLYRFIISLFYWLMLSLSLFCCNNDMLLLFNTVICLLLLLLLYIVLSLYDCFVLKCFAILNIFVLLFCFFHGCCYCCCCVLCKEKGKQKQNSLEFVCVNLNWNFCWFLPRSAFYSRLRHAMVIFKFWFSFLLNQILALFHCTIIYCLSLSHYLSLFLSLSRTLSIKDVFILQRILLTNGVLLALKSTNPTQCLWGRIYIGLIDQRHRSETWILEKMRKKV